MSRFIVNVRDGVPLNEAADYVAEVIRKGKISGNGQSYCYAVRFSSGVVVSTDKPRKGSNTHVFYVLAGVER
jgi:hypothetical protein